MRIRLALTLDVHRDRPWTPEPEQEHAPEVTVKGSYILERRPADDFDRPGLVGFCANPGEPR
jgi:hypothetical protein